MRNALLKSSQTAPPMVAAAAACSSARRVVEGAVDTSRGRLPPHIGEIGAQRLPTMAK